MSNKVFITEPDSHNYHSDGTLTYLMPTETKIIPISNTLISEFEQIGVTQRRRKSIPIRGFEYTYNHLTSEQIKIIRRFFESPEIEWEKGSFWLPELNTDYLIVADERMMGLYYGPGIYTYAMKDVEQLAQGQSVFIMNHHRNYDMRYIIVINLTPGFPVPYSSCKGVMFSDVAIREQDLPGPLTWGTRLNYEVLGKVYQENPPNPAIPAPEPPWGVHHMHYDIEWFTLNLYKMVKVRLFDSKEFPEDVSGFDGKKQFYDISLKFREDLMESN